MLQFSVLLNYFFEIRQCFLEKDFLVSVKLLMEPFFMCSLQSSLLGFSVIYCSFMHICCVFEPPVEKSKSKTKYPTFLLLPKLDFSSSVHANVCADKCSVQISSNSVQTLLSALGLPYLSLIPSILWCVLQKLLCLCVLQVV